MVTDNLVYLLNGRQFCEVDKRFIGNKSSDSNCKQAGVWVYLGIPYETAAIYDVCVCLNVLQRC